MFIPCWHLISCCCLNLEVRFFFLPFMQVVYEENCDLNSVVAKIVVCLGKKQYQQGDHRLNLILLNSQPRIMHF